jgi:integrase-like protein/uncharacterized methyltransferase DUF6094
MRNVARLKMGYYPLREAEGVKLRTLLAFAEPASVIDPCVGQGTALQLVTSEAPVRCYGVELDAERARILHCNVTKHPTSAWVARQLREVFPYDTAPRFLIFDRGANFSEEVVGTIKSLRIQPKRISFKSPWQNGVAKRFVGNCRRDLLNHVIVLNERHLKRLMNEYVSYYHEDRTHLAFAKERLRAAMRRRAQLQVAGLYQCRGSVVCIIATIWPADSLVRKPLPRIANESRIRGVAADLLTHT